MAGLATEARPAAPRTAGRPAPPARRRVRLRGVLAPLTLLLVLVGAWQLYAAGSDNPLVPDVGEVWTSLRTIVAGNGLSELATSLGRVLLGFLVAFALAIAAGLAMGRNALVRAALEPLVVLGLTIPGLVWALLCVIWFGVALATPVVAIALGVAPALVLSVVQGVRSVDPGLVEMAHVFRFSPATRVRRLWLPALAPHLLSGARLGLSLAWKVIVLVEMFGLSSGVGYQLNQSFSAQDTAGVIAWTLLFGAAMAVLEYGVLAVVERRVTRWRREATV